MSTQAYWLRAIRLSGIGPRKFLKLLSMIGDIETVFSITRDEWMQLGLTEKNWEMLQQTHTREIEADLMWLNQQTEHHIICFDDDAYPAILKEIADPPLVIYVRGNKKALHQLQIAIVGSRRATTQGIKQSEAFASALADEGFAITSGLALGIDGASHLGAIRQNGITIGVAGTGLTHIYPKSHERLYDKIFAHNGAIISELPLKTPALAQHFPRRNRIIAGLSIGVLVVEAALKSGSLITARLALEYGREVFAIPGSIQNPLARGCHYLIRQGAKLVETTQDILDELSIKPAISSSMSVNNSKEMVDLSQNEQQMLNYIMYEITPVDMLLLRSGLTAGELSSILLALELKGKIEAVPGGYVRV